MERRSFFSFGSSGITIMYSVNAAWTKQVPTSHTTCGIRLKMPIIIFLCCGCALQNSVDVYVMPCGSPPSRDAVSIELQGDGPQCSTLRPQAFNSRNDSL